MRSISAAVSRRGPWLAPQIRGQSPFIQATGLSASTVSRLQQVWGQEYRSWCEAPLDKERWVYIWADGVYSGLRGEQEKLCALVVIGVNARGEKHFLAIEDGVRESTQSWREVLLKLKARGMNVAELAIEPSAPRAACLVMACCI